MFVVITGGDGSGKDTVAEWVQQFLSVDLVFQEPGGTVWGALIYDRLYRQNWHRDPITELFLLMAARNELVEYQIAPALEQGKRVLCKRYTYDTHAYQGGGWGIDHALIERLNMVATGHLRPDVVIYLDVHPEIGLARKQKQRPLDTVEGQGIDFHHRVRAEYLRQYKQHTDSSQWWLVDANLSLEEVRQQVEGICRIILKQRT